MSRRSREYGLRYPFNNSVDYTRVGLHKEQRKLNTRGKTMEIPIKEHKVIPAGEHYGVIIKVDYRTQPLEYTDYHLSFVAEGERVTVKASYPTNITPETIHGKMLARFGLQIAPGLKVDPDKLIGLKCEFTTMNKPTPKGTFPEVMRDSLKPMPVETKPAPTTTAQS